MKSYTNIEQSKKLAEILPLDSADMCYKAYREEGGIPDYQVTLCPYQFASWIGVPCWSLAALLDQLDDVIYDEDGHEYQLQIIKEGVQYYLIYDSVDYAAYYDTPLFDNLIDACVEMIFILKEID